MLFLHYTFANAITKHPVCTLCLVMEKDNYAGDPFSETRPKKRGTSYLHRTATTAYPCFLPDLGEFSRSWSCKTCPWLQK